MAKKRKFISGIKKSPVDIRDFKYESIIYKNLPEELDLRDKMFKVKDQGNQGSCSAMTACQMKENQEINEIGLKEELSPQFVYNLRSNYPGEGMTPRDTMKVLEKYGIIEDKYYPYGKSKSNKIKQDILDQAYKYKIAGYAKINSIDGLKVSLINNGVCYIGVPVYNETKRMWIQRPKDEFLGGHALCCTPNTIIKTDTGIKQIKDIDFKDNVVTREGIKSIVKLTNRFVNENIYKIYSQLSVEPLSITGEHPILVRKCSSKTKESLLDMSKYEFVEAKDIKKGYYVKSKIDDTIKENNISKDFARLLGYYVGDGNIQIEYTKSTGNIKSIKFRITYNRIDKKEIIQDVIDIIKKEYPKVNHSIYEDKKSNTNIITFYSTELGKRIASICGTANNKKIGEVLYIEPEKQLEFIKGWYKTDGYGEWLKESSIFTSEKFLAEELILLLQRNRLTYSVCKKDKNITIIRNKEYNCKGGYKINFHLITKKDRLKYKEDEVYSRIKKIEIIPYRGLVYNFEVKDCNEYIANNLLVHNCVVGFNKEGFIIRNSWGSSWGDKGHCILPYEDWKHVWECWTAVDAETVSGIKKPSKCKEFFSKVFNFILNIIRYNG